MCAKSRIYAVVIAVVELEEFHEIIKGVLEVLEGQAKRIEREKLKVRRP